MTPANTPEAVPSITIRHLTGGLQGQAKSFSCKEVTLGTGPRCAMRLDPIWDVGVSSCHARVFRDASGVWWIEDRSCGGGSFLDGRRLTAPLRVQGSCTVELGRNGVQLELVTHQASPVQPSALPARTRGLSPTLTLLALALVAFACLAYRPSTSQDGDLVARLKEFSSGMSPNQKVTISETVSRVENVKVSVMVEQK
jgi:hypothetical protein